MFYSNKSKAKIVVGNQSPKASSNAYTFKVSLERTWFLNEVTKLKPDAKLTLTCLYANQLKTDKELIRKNVVTLRHIKHKRT